MASVLVADDDGDILELVTFKLARLGLDVITAVDGARALHLARTRHVDLAILDVSMTGLSGLDVTRAIRADPATRDLPVMLLSAHAFPRDVARGYEAGADDYVTKPFLLRDLTSRITALLSDGRPVREVREAPGTRGAPPA